MLLREAKMGLGCVFDQPIGAAPDMLKM